ncbi:MAG: hypothetical protein NE328_01155 [Lentisphaeraceae bacterium]|nr:hypothetical protein [Lentisphaeraceae bacterium]
MIKNFAKAFLIGLLSHSALNAAQPEGYNIETVKTPERVLFHVTGLDIAKDGTVYCATRFGDVWSLKDNTWTHYAKGLHEPCGLLVDDDGSIVVTQKPELTRLVDINKDGKADEYIKISSDFEFHNNYHEFNYGGVKDNEGNYVGTLNLAHGDSKALKLSTMVSQGGYRGWAYKVTPEGKFIPWASGLRSPAGIGKNSAGDIFYTDNQGDFVGTSMLHQITKDAFYGHPVSLLDKGYSREKIKAMNEADWDKMRTVPVAWIPHGEIANSPGNPEWDTTKGKFGPFKNQFFIGDQTRSSVFRVSLQKVGDIYQGCVFDFMTGFQSGAMRLKFDNDGALWVGETGRGWTARGGKQYGLQKVTWDGTVPFEIQDVKMTKDGFKVTFTKTIDEATAQNFQLDNWWYEYRRGYGSPKGDMKTDLKKTVTLSDDKKSLEVKTDLEERKVYGFDFTKIKDANGKSLANPNAFYTLVKKLK